MQIKIKYQNNSIEKIEKIEKGDWIDLRAAETVELKKGCHYMIPLGVAMQLPLGYEAHLVARSSTFKKWGFLQTNAVGIIDNTYCGDGDWWLLSVYATRDATIVKNERIAQFRIFEKMPVVELIEVQALGNTNRGGFGSTGNA